MNRWMNEWLDPICNVTAGANHCEGGEKKRCKEPITKPRWTRQRYFVIIHPLADGTLFRPSVRPPPALHLFVFDRITFGHSIGIGCTWKWLARGGQCSVLFCLIIRFHRSLFIMLAGWLQHEKNDRRRRFLKSDTRVLFLNKKLLEKWHFHCVSGVLLTTKVSGFLTWRVRCN